MRDTLHRVTNWLLLGLATAVIVALAGMPTPVRAGETCPAPLPDVTAAIERQGGALLDLVDLPGANFDQAAFFDMQGTIIMGMVINGCMIGGPVALGEMREATPA